MLITASIKRVRDFSCSRDVRFWPIPGPHFGRKSSVDTVGVTSALPSEADIRLILVKRSANDPKQTWPTTFHTLKRTAHGRADMKVVIGNSWLTLGTN